jgi:hypothetical protein
MSVQQSLRDFFEQQLQRVDSMDSEELLLAYQYQIKQHLYDSKKEIQPDDLAWIGLGLMMQSVYREHTVSSG